MTYVFYEGEEVAAAHNGLGRLFADRPDCSRPTWRSSASRPTARSRPAARARIRLRASRSAGARAHTARPWMGRNAIHRLGAVLRLVDGYEERRPVIDGCEYREALQAVRIEGGVAGNVVPDEAP